VEALPDLGTLSDSQLRQMIRDLEREENEVSYRRRILQGKIDILRAELVARLQRAVGEGQSALTDVDLERLSEILASKAPPPEEGGVDQE
jgi:hypothetical protein